MSPGRPEKRKRRHSTAENSAAQSKPQRSGGRTRPILSECPAPPQTAGGAHTQQWAPHASRGRLREQGVLTDSSGHLRCVPAPQRRTARRPSRSVYTRGSRRARSSAEGSPLKEKQTPTGYDRPDGLAADQVSLPLRLRVPDVHVTSHRDSPDDTNASKKGADLARPRI